MKRRAALLVAALALSSAAAAQEGEPEPRQAPIQLVDPQPVRSVVDGAARDRTDFCERPSDLSGSERALCPLAEASRARCPGFLASCQRKTAERAEILTGSWAPFLRVFGATLSVLFWCVLVFGGVIVLAVILRSFLARARAPVEPAARERAATVTTAAAPAVPVAPDVHLSRARELADHGALREAMAELLMAFLRALEIRGQLELHPARTNGEYARKLRGQREVAEAFRAFSAEVEAVEFGGVAATQERYRALRDHVVRSIGAAGVALSLVLLISGCGAGGPRAREGGSPCGGGAADYSVLCEILESRGAAVRKRFRGLDAGIEADTIFLLEDRLDGAQRAALLEWVEEGGRLVVSTSFPAFLGPAATTKPCLDELEPHAGHGPVRLRLPSARALEVTARDALVRCGELAFAVARARGAGWVVAVADERFLTNAGLVIDDNAVVAASLVEHDAGSVELVGDWTDAGADLPTTAVARSGLLPWLLHALALGLAFALYRGAPFGSRREPASGERRAFAEHARALGHAYGRARASEIALVHYGNWVMDRLRLRAVVSGQSTLNELASATARRLGTSEGALMKLLVNVRSAAEERPDPANEAENLATLRELVNIANKAGKKS